MEIPFPVVIKKSVASGKQNQYVLNVFFNYKGAVQHVSRGQTISP
jgi:hypothetical protein